jgi:hypothetical protein
MLDERKAQMKNYPQDAKLSTVFCVWTRVHFSLCKLQ